MQDRPTAAELTDAVSHFLQTEIAPTLSDPRQRFRVLIAANLMAIVTRELQAGDAPLHAEWSRLSALLGAADPPPADSVALCAAIDGMGRELCARIRRGDADGGPWADSTLAYAEESVVEKLRIANPKFLQRLAG